MCKVSVIVPVYQVEAYLPRCIDSILAQSFQDYELILVNDGTKDGCPAIMDAYAARDGRIRQVHKENGGLSSARNAGLDIACGEYIAFVDSDDYIAPDLLEDAVAAAEQTGAEQVLWNYRYVDDRGEYDARLSFEDEVIDVERLGLAAYFYQYWMPYRHGQEAWSKLYRRSIIEENGLRFAPNKEIFAEDTLFSAMYLMHTHRIAALSKPYVYYYQRGDSLMGMKKPALARRLMNLGIRLFEYAQACGKGDELYAVLPVLCYDKLICKGIRLDPDAEDVVAAMQDMQGHPVMRTLLRRLLGVRPLLAYTIRTGKGIRTQLRGRLFAWRWLRGDVRGAMALVQGREDAAK
ncbi:MAG: glycosyltransferase family 2 protein [Clostridia bacterium]|nr:glycosyltransferase family 2 protein [Clostridia bacterium]